jgi:lambda repressor-like predicted transcriptional regulator
MHNDFPIDRERHARIKYELELRGLTLADIARDAKVGTSAVSSVSVGKSRSHRLESLIAKAIGTTAAQLFPERFVNSRGD